MCVCGFYAKEDQEQMLEVPNEPPQSAPLLSIIPNPNPHLYPLDINLECAFPKCALQCKSSTVRFFCVILGFELRAYTLSHSTSPFFVKGFFLR
jgi:hypothetical protein